MKKQQKLISLLLSAVMAVSAFSTFGASASDAPLLISPNPNAAKTDPTTIDRIIVNARNEDVFSESMSVYKHTPTEIQPDPLTGGKYSFSDAEQAMELEYAENKRQPDWRAMVSFVKKNMVTEEYKYFVMVYKVKTTGTYKMTLWNSPGAGPEYVIAAEGTDTGDNFVYTQPYDISQTNDAGSILARWVAGNINTIGIESEDKDLKFYVREFGFFKSEADAKAYYANVDLDKDPPEIDEEAIDEANLPAPVIMKFDTTVLMMGNGFTYYTDDTNVSSANYTATKVGDVSCIKLNYVPSERWEAYRTMPRMNANMITDQHKYVRIVYMTTDPTANKITLYANAGGGNAVLAENTAVSKGEWVVGDAVDISSGSLLPRYVEGKHNTIEFNSANPNAEFYIKEIGFFCSLNQAGKHYGDVVTAHQALTFGDQGNSGFFSGENYGVYDINNVESTVDIKYAESTNMKVNFCSKIKFNDANILSPDYKYARIYYRATIPNGQDHITMKLYNDGGGDLAIFGTNIKDTNGEFVLTKTVEISEGMIERLRKPMHTSLFMDCTDPNAVFSIKAIYFFPTKTAANSFDPSQKQSEITVCGNSINDYRIVVSEDAGDRVYIAANLLAARINALCGKQLEIVTDKEAANGKEILIGNTNRPQSAKLYEGFTSYDQFAASVENGSIAINAFLPANLSDAVTDYMANHLYLNLDNPEKIALDETSTVSSVTANMKYFDQWQKDALNVAEPEVFTDSFDTDSGYFTEESNTSDWKVADGVYATDTDDLALTYIHVYEKDAELGAKMKFTRGNGNMGVLLRYVGEDGWLKAGYDFEAGEWYIDEREGNDFYLLRKASAKATINPDNWYNVVFKVDGTTATLTVDGNVVASANNIALTSAGRVGFYADNAAVALDDAKLTLLSGEGTIWKNVTHMKIDNDVYTEGGSAWELNDGSVHFEHSRIAYKSLDKGYTWEKTDKRLGVSGYPTLIRLNDGSLLRTWSRASKYITAESSTDEGKTWTEIGIITNRWWQLNGQDTTAGAGNMNDKMFQSATTGRIFYSQNYETQAGPVEGRSVFCEFFYSDDNGKTWTKSETDSWELPGNETQTHFGECKMLECADGTIRIYNSWNPTGNIQYTESTDNGVTWGPLTPLEGFKCTQSSMQFVRDPYAENDTTYYMIWINNERAQGYASSCPRSRLSLAKTTDGKNWTVLGDIWRWEPNWVAPNTAALINQIVDPFIQVTESTIIVGSGISEQLALSTAADNDFHQAQREHIWTLDKKANDPGEKLYNFTDVTTKDSYYDAIKYAVDNGLFNGTSETTFSPAASMTRAMFVTVLGRLAKADVAAYATPTFNDVLAGQWYTSYVEWAAANGIVNGLGNGIYGINDNVTVQQACVILARYADYKAAATQTGKTAADFADGANVASWAAKEVDWAIANGIYNGAGASLNPTSAASRATVATMFANYVKAFG